MLAMIPQLSLNSLKSTSPRTSELAETSVGLRSELPDYLLRGVPSNDAFKGYGRHFKNSVGSASDFALSVPTESIDDFISHDWRTPRIVKYAALCYLYNSKAALIGSTLIAGLVVSTREFLRYGNLWRPAYDEGLLLHDQFGCLSVGPIVYLALLFHWQNILAILGPAPLLFVDKLCIAQHDEQMKRQGIRALAAFLKKTRRIVVLWSPQYFDRLWCTYELAAWFRMKRKMSSVRFVPVALPVKLICWFLAVAMGCLSAQNVVIAGSKTGQDPGLTLFVLLVASTVGTYVLQGQMLHVAELRQLEEFSIQRTSCFCCSNNHTHPESGAHLACDREMVYSMLKRWFESQGCSSDNEAHLERFNGEVRNSLLSHVTRDLPEHMLFLRYFDFVHIAFPYFWWTIDYLLYKMREGERGSQLRLYLFEGLCYMLLTIPLALSFVFYMMNLARPLMLRKSVQDSVATRILLACCLWGPLCTASVGVLIALDSTSLYLRPGHHEVSEWMSTLLPYHTKAGWFILFPVSAKAVVAWAVFGKNIDPDNKYLRKGTFSLGKSSSSIASSTPLAKRLPSRAFHRHQYAEEGESDAQGHREEVAAASGSTLQAVAVGAKEHV
eukprot:TRINITY_DN13503_c0_g3_i1.p1 TRINITY_DN13503_c0_g3~~TRINITY_DN13503_c0_g3_i1.p1  ORF type:complete len:610 (-),score=34.89 TRINITY_DN13503_c0_g3_i1:385-2214(-)